MHRPVQRGGQDSRHSIWATTLAVMATAVIALANVGVGNVSAAPAQPGGCPGLMVYAVQGTGQSSPDADPSKDAGFLSQVLHPAITAARGDMDRAYVPYDAGFGGAVAGGKVPYEQSVQGAVAKTLSWIKDKAAACPATKFGLVGYSQGAHVTRIVLNDIVGGKAAIGADKLALLANLGDPGRPEGASLFPGKPGQTSPDPVPGTSGANVSKVVAVSTTNAPGGGIAPVGDVEDTSYQAIAGRYLSACTPGDLACDAPANAPLARLVTNIAGQSELNPDDPIGSLSTIAEALALTAVKTAVPVVNEDVQAPENNLESVSYQPRQTLSERLAVASDPRTPLPSVQDALSAVIKVGTIGFNAVKTVVQTVATPSTIAAIATAGAANPLAIVGILGAKLGQAAVTLVPPATQERLVSEAFTAFKSEFQANSDLFKVSSLLKYWDAAKQHTSYSQVSATPTGQPPTKLIGDWIVAAARDIAGKDGGSSNSSGSGSGSDDFSWLFGEGSAGSSTLPSLTTTSFPPSAATSEPAYPWELDTSSPSASSETVPSGSSPVPQSTPPGGASGLPPFLSGASQ